MHGLALSLYFAANLNQFAGNPAEVERMASALIELSTRHNFAFWLAACSVLRGWASSASGDTAEGIPRIEQGIRDYRATGSVMPLPYMLALKAESLHLADHTSEALEAITEAEALAARTEERWWCAEMHRLRGIFLAAIRADQTQGFILRSHQNRKGAEVSFARETRLGSLRRISSSKSERRGRTWIPTTSLVTSCSTSLSRSVAAIWSILRLLCRAEIRSVSKSFGLRSRLAGLAKERCERSLPREAVSRVFCLWLALP